MFRQAAQLYRLFDATTRWRIGGLFMLMLVAAAMEFASIGMVLPLLQVVTAPERLNDTPYLAWVHNALGTNDPFELVLWLAVALFAFFLVKSLFLAALIHIQNRFVYDRQAAFTRDLLNLYLRQPYAFHLDRNSAELVRNLTWSAPMVFSTGLLPLLNVTLELLLALAAGLVLLSVEPVATLITGAVLGLSAFAMDRSVKPHYLRWGKCIESDSTALIQWINQGLGSVKESAVLGCQDFFRDRFAAISFSRGRAQAMSNTARQMPRLMFEALAVGCLAIMVLTLKWQGADLNQLVPSLGVFGVAAFRLLPSLNRILGHTASLKLGTAAIDAVFGDFMLRLPERMADRGTKLSHSLALDRLGFTYPNTIVPAVNDVSLMIERGTSVAFIGPSGSGKTTLADLILGLLEPQSGAILVDGRPEVAGVLGHRVGYVPQSVYLSDDTLRSNIAFGIAPADVDEDQVREAVRLAQLESFVAGLPDGLDTEVGERGVRLSGGQRQRIGIARALYDDRDVLVLDEATSALDGEMERAVSQAIEGLKGRKTLIIIAHRLSTVRHCDILYRFEAGRKVAEGSFDALYAGDPEFRRQVDAGRLFDGPAPQGSQP